MVKICLVSDIHHGKNKYSNIYNDAIPLIHEFNDFCDEHKPDLVIELGDRIHDSTHQTDFKLASEVAKAFATNKYTRIALRTAIGKRFFISRCDIGAESAESSKNNNNRFASYPLCLQRR